MTTPNADAGAGNDAGTNNDAAAAAATGADAAAAAGAGAAGGGAGDGAAGGAAGGKAAAGDGSLLGGADAAGKKAEGEGAKGDEPQLPGWKDYLKDAIKDDKLRDHAGRFTTLDDLVKGNIELRKQVSSRDGWVKVPGEKASDEEVAAWRKAVGVPDAPEAYGIGVKEGAPEEDAAELGLFLREMHHANAPKALVERIVEFERDREAARERRKAERVAKAQDEAAARLQGEWRGDFKRNAELANRAFEHLADTETRSLVETVVDGRKLGDHPGFLKLFAKVGDMLSAEIPVLAAGRDALLADLQALEKEENEKFGTPAWGDAAFQRRREEIRTKAASVRGG